MLVPSTRDLEQQIKDLKKERGDPNLLERIEKTLSGSAKLYGAQFLGVDEWLSNVEQSYQEWKEDAGIPSGGYKDGPGGRVWGEEPTAESARKQAEYVQNLGSNLKESGAADVERAKEGLDGVGRILVDVGVAGSQMLGDVGLGIVTGGGSMLPMLVRSFGGGVQEAREKGYGVAQQTGLGLASAATEYFTERLFDGNPAYDKDGLINKLVERVAGDGKLVSALSSVPAEIISEGLEEVIADILEPISEKVLTGNWTGYDIEQIIHDGIVGMALGGLGQGGQYIADKTRGAVAQKNTSNTAVIKADTSLFDRTILKNFNEARKNFIAYAKEHFPASVVNRDTGRTIGISRNGLDKFLSGNLYYEKYASGFHIPELIQNATKVAEAGNYHTQAAESIPSYEYYDSPLTIDGANYMAHIRVRNTLVGDKYYGHTISQVESIEIEPSTRASVPDNPAVQSVNIDGSDQHSQSSADAGTIAQLSDDVKHEKSTSASYADTLREMQPPSARQSKSYADELAHVDELLQNAALSPRDQAYIQEDIADAQRSCDVAVKVIADPSATAEKRAQAVRRAIDALDYARGRIDDLGLPATRLWVSTAQDVLADIAERLKSYLLE